MRDAKNKRNAFVALCEHASNKNLCWLIWCGTCGHMEFRYAFSKIVHDKHPDNKSFWLMLERDEYDDFLWKRVASEGIKMRLASIVAEAKIKNIQQVARFPDWLGYIGLVIFHCKSSNKEKPSKAHKILTDALLPQFIQLTKIKGSLCNYFREKKRTGKMLTIEDLEKIEGMGPTYNERFYN